MKGKNKRSKLKPRDVIVFEQKLQLKKGERKELNKEYPDLKKKRLDILDLPKIIEFKKNKANRE